MSKWQTHIVFVDSMLDKLREVCSDIYDRDSTFIYTITVFGSKYSGESKLIITSDTKSQAHLRGSWFKKKVDDSLFWHVFEVGRREW